MLRACDVYSKPLSTVWLRLIITRRGIVTLSGRLSTHRTASVDGNNTSSSKYQGKGAQSTSTRHGVEYYGQVHPAYKNSCGHQPKQRRNFWKDLCGRWLSVASRPQFCSKTSILHIIAWGSCFSAVRSRPLLRLRLLLASSRNSFTNNSVTHKSFTRNFATHSSFTHNSLTHNSFTHNSLTDNFVTHLFFHTQLCHTQSFTNQLTRNSFPNNFAWHLLTSTLVAPTLCVACVALGDIDIAVAGQAWHLVARLVLAALSGRRGTWWHWAGSGGRLGSCRQRALGDVDVAFVWQAGACWHRPPFCVAGVAKWYLVTSTSLLGVALTALDWCWALSQTSTHNAFTRNFVMRHFTLGNTWLGHVIRQDSFYMHLFHAHLFHAPLLRTNLSSRKSSHTTHSHTALSSTTLSLTTLAHAPLPRPTLLNTYLSHASLMRHTTLSHATLAHTTSFTHASPTQSTLHHLLCPSCLLRIASTTFVIIGRSWLVGFSGPLTMLMGSWQLFTYQGNLFCLLATTYFEVCYFAKFTPREGRTKDN